MPRKTIPIYDGDDFEADMARTRQDEATKRWLEVVVPCQRPLDSAGEGEWWAEAQEIFHLD